MKKSIAIFVFLTTSVGAASFAQDTKEKEPPPPPPRPPIIEVVKYDAPVIVDKADLNQFYKRNPSVSAIRWKSQQEVILSFKDKEKKSESYNLADKNQAEAFHEKYGDAPKTVPSPPPPPPKKTGQS